LYSHTYGRVSSLNLDPIEKKPLYHFYPGEQILSVGSVGCNFRCQFCQNYEISQTGPLDYSLRELTVDQILQLLKKYNLELFAFTYNEPLVNLEWLIDVSKVLAEKNYKVVLVTNGYVNSEPAQELFPYIAAANVDLKSFSDSFYRKICGGSLAPVLKTIEKLKEMGKWVELTTLLIPGLNDSPSEIAKIVDWVAQLDKNIPLHFSRYFPNYRMNNPATDAKILLAAGEIARQKLSYVYIGNIELKNYSNTICPHCGNLLIRRSGYFTEIVGLKESPLRCQNCGKDIAIIMKKKV